MRAGIGGISCNWGLVGLGVALRSGGAMLIGADDDASAQAIAAADPAVVAGTFTYELRQWAFVDWASLAKRKPG